MLHRPVLQLSLASAWRGVWVAIFLVMCIYPASLFATDESRMEDLGFAPQRSVLGLSPTASPGVGSSPGSNSMNVAARKFWLPDSLETGWLAPDKQLHFFVCYSIVLSGEVATDELGTGIIGAVVLSTAKELWDLWFKEPACRRGVSKKDLVADVVGITVASLFVVLSEQ